MLHPTLQKAKVPVVGVGAEPAEAAEEPEIVGEVLPRLLRHEAVAHRDKVLEGLGHFQACDVDHGHGWMCLYYTIYFSPTKR